ncbi:hypothetical protein U1Q18_009005 [Sarracenia purpurea var. burkii]
MRAHPGILGCRNRKGAVDPGTTPADRAVHRRIILTRGNEARADQGRPPTEQEERREAMLEIEIQPVKLEAKSIEEHATKA